MKDWLLARFPALEVGARLAYWRVKPVHRAVQRLRARRPARRPTAADHPPPPIDFDGVLATLRDIGVASGDMLIVHSSFAALKPTGLSPADIVARLRDFLGPQGTLAMPAIPIIANEPQGQDKLGDAAYARTFRYDPASTRIGTGALPKAMLGLPGAARSLHPGNSMVAIGPHAEAMMAHNLREPKPSACGRGSAWHFAYEHDAWIVAIGVDLVHSLTMIHVAEEAFPERWPVPNWYRERDFIVGTGEEAFPLTIRERRHGWSQYYAERAFSRDLYRDGIAVTRIVDGLAIHACSSRALVDYLLSHPRPAYPYVFPLGIPGR